jgi:hypothetical protein
MSPDFNGQHEVTATWNEGQNQSHPNTSNEGQRGMSLEVIMNEAPTDSLHILPRTISHAERGLAASHSESRMSSMCFSKLIITLAGHPSLQQFGVPSLATPASQHAEMVEGGNQVTIQAELENPLVPQYARGAAGGEWDIGPYRKSWISLRVFYY